jgi:aminopeptidase N
MHAPDNEDTVACYVQFQSADSMENTVAALRLLVARTDRLRDQALAEAYERWRHSPELIDQWFAIQAASEADDCAQRVSGLLRHPDWSLDNGARLKAFFDAFARNQSAFHDASGVGYEIVASTVINLNESNPRLAARLLKHLDGGARFDPARHAAIRRQLERVLSLPRLADDLYEIASRSLQAGAR